MDEQMNGGKISQFAYPIGEEVYCPDPIFDDDIVHMIRGKISRVILSADNTDIVFVTVNGVETGPFDEATVTNNIEIAKKFEGYVHSKEDPENFIKFAQETNPERMFVVESQFAIGDILGLGFQIGSIELTDAGNNMIKVYYNCPIPGLPQPVKVDAHQFGEIRIYPMTPNNTTEDEIEHIVPDQEDIITPDAENDTSNVIDLNEKSSDSVEDSTSEE